MIPSMKTFFALFCASFLFLSLEAQYLDSASSLGGAKVGIYSRNGVFGDSENIASLGDSPVGVYRKYQNPVLFYPVARVPGAYPVRVVVDRKPKQQRPSRPRPKTNKPGDVSGRNLLGGLLGGVLG